jgi:hypothetical protein
MSLIWWDTQTMSAARGGGGELRWSYSTAAAVVELPALEAVYGSPHESGPGVWSWHARSMTTGGMSFHQVTLIDLTGQWPADEPAPGRALPSQARSALVESRGAVSAAAPLFGRLGRLRLPSGASVLVSRHGDEPDDEGATLIELGGDVVVVLRWDSPDVAELSLHIRPKGAPTGEWPYGSEAAVRYDPAADRLVVIPAPAGRHSECCPGEDERLVRWWTDVGADDVIAIVDLLAGLHRADWCSLGDGMLLWRGGIDNRRRAIVELVTDAVLAHEVRGDLRDFDTAAFATIEIGLSPAS